MYDVHTEMKVSDAKVSYVVQVYFKTWRKSRVMSRSKPALILRLVKPMSDSKLNVMIHHDDMLYDFHLRVGDGDAPLEVNFVLGPRRVRGCPVRLH